MRIRLGEVKGLLDETEVSSPLWFVYNNYTVIGGQITEDLESDWREQYTPLQEPNLFLSFARLAARGQPSQHSVLNWTHGYGLLRTPKIGIETFRAEAREAYRALSLLEQIRGGDTVTLRSRLSYRQKDPLSNRQIHLDDEDIGIAQHREHNPRRTYWESVTRDGKQVDVLRHVDDASVDLYIYPTTDDDMVLAYAVWGLEHIVTNKLVSVRRVFGAGDDEHPYPLAEWRPKLADYCPDLMTALWYQFAKIVEERRPIKRCVICGNPFTSRRSTRETCSDACRQAKSRRNRRTRTH